MIRILCRSFFRLSCAMPPLPVVVGIWCFGAAAASGVYKADGDADTFESDDLPARATWIGVDAATQAHTFHKSADADWAAFYVPAGNQVTIETQNLGGACDTRIELYAANGLTLLDSNDDRAVGDPSSRLVRQVNQSGLFYVVVVHANPQTFGPGTNYDLRVFRETGTCVSDAVISGVVTDAATLLPLAGAQVFLTQVGSGFSWTTLSDGTYVIPGLPAGVYAVRAAAPLYQNSGSFLVFSNCNQDFTVNIDLTPTPPELSVSSDTLNVGADAGSSLLQILNLGGGTMNWTVSVEPGSEWLAVSPTDGTGDSAITVSFFANPTSNARTGTLQVDAPGAVGSPATVTVNQGGQQMPVLQVSPTGLNVGSAAGSTSVLVRNVGGGTLTWDATVTAGADWLSAAAAKASGDGTILVSFLENLSPDDRVGAILVEAPGATGSPVSINVTQAGDTTPTLSVSPTDLSVGSAAGSSLIQVRNTGQGTLNWVASVTSGNDWLAISPAGGAGDGTITASFTQNAVADARVGLIRVSATGATGSPVTVVVSQASDTTPVLEVTPSSLSLGSGSGSTTISVQNAGNGVLTWTASVTSGGDWLSITASKVTGDGTIFVTHQQNTSANTRNGTIRVEAPGAVGSPVTIFVSQAGDTTPVLEVIPTAFNVGSGSGSATIAVHNAGNGVLTWTASVTSGNEWLSISASKVAGDGTILVTHQQNPSANSRSGTIRVEATGATGSPITVVVTQAGDTTPVLRVQPTEVNVGAASGSTSVLVHNAGNGTLVWNVLVTSGSDWLSVGSSKITGDGTLSILFEQNVSADTRVGTIRVQAPGAIGSPVTIQVTQAGDTMPALHVSPTSMNVTSSSGSTPVLISNVGNGQMSWTVAVTSGSEWLSASPTVGVGDGSVLLNHAQNLSAEARLGTVRITSIGAAGSPVTVTVLQAGDTTPVLNVTPLQLNVGFAAGSDVITVTNRGQGTLIWIAAVTSDSPWLTINLAKVAGDGTIEAVFEENPSGNSRTGTITVTASGAAGSPTIVTVTQAGNTTPVLRVTPDSLSFAKEGGVAILTVKNVGFGTLEWTFSEQPAVPWLSAAIAKITGNGNLEVSVAANTQSQGRSTTIVIDAPGAQGSPVVVPVVQAGTGLPPENIDGLGDVDAVDVQLVINAALGLDIGGLDADVNDDGNVNAVDIQRVINAALGL